MNYDNYLYHYGVIGMKWGVQKQRKASIKAAKQKANKKAEIANKRIDAKKKVDKYGSKKKAVEKMTSNANKAAEARQVLKQGAGIAASLHSIMEITTYANAVAAADIFAKTGFITGASLAGGLPIPVYSLMAAGGAAAAVAAKKRVSKRSMKKIANVKKYG